MYAWRGYGSAHQVKASPSRITLTASDKEKVIGTVTLGIDSEEGLLADEIFKPEIDKRRNAGGKVCELTKLAFDPDIRSKFALASLFHIVFIYGRRMHNCTDVFIEVNPRHRRFYETMLGFRRQCEIRTNPRVNAPAVLLWVDIGYVEEQIHKYGGTSDNPDTTRSLYPYFFSPREEAGIHGRLVSLG
ncbi:N-acetyltransferase|nr:N-acetyltransferase [Noviherbaspirillum sp. L7-7A]